MSPADSLAVSHWLAFLAGAVAGVAVTLVAVS